MIENNLPLHEKNLQIIEALRIATKTVFGRPIAGSYWNNYYDKEYRFGYYEEEPEWVYITLQKLGYVGGGTYDGDYNDCDIYHIHNLTNADGQKIRLSYEVKDVAVAGWYSDFYSNLKEADMQHFEAEFYRTLNLPPAISNNYAFLLDIIKNKKSN